MNKDLIKTYQFDKSLNEMLERIYEEEHIVPGRKYIQYLKKEARKECRMSHHSTHKRHFESHAEEQKRLAKNEGHYYAFVYYDEEKNFYKCCRGHYKGKKIYRKCAARKVRREYNKYHTEVPAKTKLPQNGGGYKKFYDLWWTLD
jgi:hypothetical protein